jgi:hypothetical protein
MDLQLSKCYLVSSSGTDVVCGYQLLRCSYNMLYFLWLYNEFFIILSNIIRKCCVRLLSNYNIIYTCTIYTRLYTYRMSISRFSLRDKVTLRQLKIHFMEWMWSSGLWCSKLLIILGKYQIVYIRLKIKPNSVRIIFLSCRMLFFPRRDLSSHPWYTAAPIA